MKERWEECEKTWWKIDPDMRNINFPEFFPPEDFSNLCGIVKWHVEKDQVYEIDIL